MRTNAAVGRVKVLLFARPSASAGQIARSARKFECHVEHGIEAAVQFLERGPSAPVELAIADSDLASDSDLAELARLAAAAARASLPVILIGPGDSPNVRRAYQLGISCCVPRPADAAGWPPLVAAIEKFWAGTVTLPRRAIAT